MCYNINKKIENTNNNFDSTANIELILVGRSAMDMARGVKDFLKLAFVVSIQ
jgi:hypothetical protein